MKILKVFIRRYCNLPNSVNSKSQGNTLRKLNLTKTEHTSRQDIRQLIVDKTELSRDHLTPEIALLLITPRCKLWYSKGDDLPFPDPFWAFYWPGGQVLTRYILDHRAEFVDKDIIDIGSGCGASSIACKMVGSKSVLANDIDEVAAEAIKLNSSINHQTNLSVTTTNLIGSLDISPDFLLLGDMFYDSDFAEVIGQWLPELTRRNVSVLIGDPGRIPLEEHPLKSKLQLVYSCPLPEQCLKENIGMDTGYVWKYGEST